MNNFSHGVEILNKFFTILVSYNLSVCDSSEVSQKVIKIRIFEHHLWFVYTFGELTILSVSHDKRIQQNLTFHVKFDAVNFVFITDVKYIG